VIDCATIAQIRGHFACRRVLDLNRTLTKAHTSFVADSRAECPPRNPRMNSTVLLTLDGPVATLSLNRPDALNALDFDMVEALVQRTGEVATNASIRVVILGGAGRHFMAGGDIRTFAGELKHPPAERQMRFQRMVEHVHAAVENLHRMPHLLIGSMQGAVAGFGLSLLNACDLVLVADDAYFTSAYRHIALSPDGGGSWTLPRLVGLRKAMEIMLLGERFDAAEALRLGLVNRVVPATELEAATLAFAHTLAAGPALALRNTRRLVRSALTRSLSEQLQAEAVSFGQCAADPDFAEGIDAFLGKRPATFGKG
jgi:2-(1,2-epoxy-1,2-dihydrophenyl)acetyl-CoA isomerase